MSCRGGLWASSGSAAQRGPYDLARRGRTSGGPLRQAWPAPVHRPSPHSTHMLMAVNSCNCPTTATLQTPVWGQAKSARDQWPRE